MSNDTTRRHRQPHPDAYATQGPSGQNGFPWEQGADDSSPPRDVQANKRESRENPIESEPDGRGDDATASNGQANGPTVPFVNATKPEADPFSLESLRLSQDFESAVGVKKLVKTVPVRKPSKEWFVRTHPAYRLHTPVLELKDGDREMYLIHPALWPALASEPTFSPRLLVPSITRQGVLFVWPIKPPGPDGRIDDWSRSALETAEQAKTLWVRVTANMALGAYDVAVASGQIANPNWPDITMQEILDIAFRDKRISDWNHPVLRRLRGED